MKRLLFIIPWVLLLVTGCTVAPNTDLTALVEEQLVEIEGLKSENAALLDQIKALEATESPEQQEINQTPASLLQRATEVVQLLKDEDMASLATYVHPTQGVRFTPYGYVNFATDQAFTAAQVPNLLSDTTVYTWGSFDGSGDPIQLTAAAYFADFVYDEDYISPHIIGNNTVIGTGNSLINMAQVYPTASFVEFHFTGFDTQYGGLDWSSLRLVFEQVGGEWMLIGIIHDQWTI